ncbi:uncharacterized protein LOC127103459 [Lathyrus oleraceus]|uniref:uncharacterized protein LOC127103459 n=1 Tax=Pisum sativum TaxID=3888 RepID=UPI0021CEBA78|nr:uncharacterized protein LOC127103459 [Pisum sativum]
MGLDDAIYGTVRSNLLVTDPLPNLNRVYSTMIQEERVRMMTRTTEERKEVISLAIQTNGRAVKGRWDGKYKFMSCTHCHRAGHDAGSCFQLVGYPEWWGDRPKNEGKSGGRGKSLQQAGTGRGRGGIVRATVNVVHTGGTSAETGVSHEDGFGLAGISAEQLLSLIGFLNVHKANSNDKMIGECDMNTWIIDTGCSNHMTGNLNRMRELRDIQSCSVGLPNGEHASAIKEGSIVLEGGLKLDNVLFVPKLKCNLISVSQMMNELKCVIQFTDKLCVVQDRTSRTLIGAVDDYSCVVWVYLLTDKREVSTMLHNFLALVERQFNKQVKIFRSDNWTEFICMRKYFLDHGIIFQTSCTGTPQQNGRVERKHRHILNVARALRFQGNLPIKFWGEFILTAGYLINRTPSTILNGKTPYEMLHGQQLEYEHLKIIGSLCYAHNQRRDGDKFASRSKKCMFIGYPYGKKGWKLFDSETENIFVSRDVEFIETEFPFVVATTLRKDDLPNNWNFAESVHDAIDDIDEIDHTLSIQRSNDMGVENIRSVLDVGIEAGTSQYTNIDETMLSSTTSTTSTNEKVDD